MNAILERISPGEKTGVSGILTVTSSYTTGGGQMAGVTLSIQIGDADVHQVGVLNVTGNAHPNGYLEFERANGFVPEIDGLSPL